MNAPSINRNLTKQAPHSPRERIANFAIAIRAADKCRASLAGKLGEYHYDCPLDNQLFIFKGITSDQFKTAVLAAKNYEAIGAWLLANGTARTSPEIEDWSDDMEAGSPMNNPEKRAYFMESCQKLGLNPEKTTTFDWLEADDHASFTANIAAKPFLATAKAHRQPKPESKPAPISKFAAIVQTPVFPKTLHHLRPASPTVTNPKPPERDNTFSKSRDTREDRGTRRMKMSHNDQTNHAR